MMPLASRHRSRTALLALSLIAPRLLVPMGYMPGTDAHGRPAIVFCDEEARAAFYGESERHAHAGGSMMHEHGGHTPAPAHNHHSPSHDACPFGMSVGPAEPAAVTISGPDSPPLFLLLPAIGAPTSRGPSVVAHGPRAPPRA